MLFPALLDLLDSKYHVDGASTVSEAALTFRNHLIKEMLCDPVQDDLYHDLSCNAQERDPSMVVTGSSVTFVFVKVNDVGVPQVLGDQASIPAPFHELGELDRNYLTTLLKDFLGNSLWSRCPPWLELLYSMFGFLRG